MSKPACESRMYSSLVSWLAIGGVLAAGCARFGYEQLEPVLADPDLDPVALTCSPPVPGGDCAGTACGACVEGQNCSGDADCQSGRCDETTQQCLLSRCDDGVQNGAESGVDCGGSCDACPVAPCTGPDDCGGAACVGGECQMSVPPLCSDGVQNQDETAIDCGGSICVACATCGDGARNQDETAVDCGGTCPACEASSGCLTGNDCTSGVCAGNVCQALSGQCTDSADCSCESFAGYDYWFCTTPLSADAAVGFCQSAGMQLVRIDDAAENAWLVTTGTAAGVFSGPNGFPLIGAADAEVDGDWAWPDGTVFWSGDSNGAAVNGLYSNWSSQSPSGGGVLNCAGILDTGLWQDLGCSSALTFICQTSACTTCATCSDTIQNQDETGIDCGGPSCAACPEGSGCNAPTDCASNVCTGNLCAPNGGGCTPTADCVCDSAGGSDYLMCATEVSQYSVAAACASAGMSPLEVSGSAENEALRLALTNAGMFTLGNEPMVWLGGSDTAVEGDWVWYDGELFWDGNPVAGVYQNWGNLQPRGAADCLGMVADGTWRSRACNSSLVYYACENP